MAGHRAKGRGAPQRVALHVGAHKTGTTVVQQFLKASADRLRRDGVRVVPRDELTPLVGWGGTLLGRPELLGAVIEGFRASDDRVLVLSHENLCGQPFVAGRPGPYPLAPPRLDALARAVDGLPTDVLLSVRPMPEFVESYYLQTVKLGGSDTFDRFLRTVDLDDLAWHPLVSALHERFGRERVHVLDFRRIRDGASGWIAEHLRVMGIDLDVPATWDRRLNGSLSDHGLRLALLGNPVLTDTARRTAFRAFLQREYSNATGPRPVLLDEATRERLRVRWADDLARVLGAGVPVPA